MDRDRVIEVEREKVRERGRQKEMIIEFWFF